MLCDGKGHSLVADGNRRASFGLLNHVHFVLQRDVDDRGLQSANTRTPTVPFVTSLYTSLKPARLPVHLHGDRLVRGQSD